MGLHVVWGIRQQALSQGCSQMQMEVMGVVHRP